MKRPRIITVAADERLATLLQPLAQERRWSMRACKRPERCIRLLERSGAAVVVLHLGELPTAELNLIARIRDLPGVHTVAIGGAAANEVICGLVSDLGADFALFPPLPLDLLPKVVAGLMDSPTKPRIAKQLEP